MNTKKTLGLTGAILALAVGLVLMIKAGCSKIRELSKRPPPEKVPIFDKYVN